MYAFSQGISCSDCLKIANCSIIRKLEKIKKKLLKAKSVQLSLFDNPNQSSQEYRKKVRELILERNTLFGNQNSCLNKRTFQALQLGYKLFLDQEYWQITDCNLCIHYNPNSKHSKKTPSHVFKGKCKARHLRKFTRGFCKDYKQMVSNGKSLPPLKIEKETLKKARINLDDKTDIVKNPFSSTDITTCLFCENFYVCIRLFKLRKACRVEESASKQNKSTALSQISSCLASRLHLFSKKNLKQFFLDYLPKEEYQKRCRFLEGKEERSSSILLGVPE